MAPFDNDSPSSRRCKRIRADRIFPRPHFKSQSIAENGATDRNRLNDNHEQPGLEFVQPDGRYHGEPEGLELVSSHGMEVVPGSSPPLERRSSLNRPEAWQYSSGHQQQQAQPLIEQEKHAVQVTNRDLEGTAPAQVKWSRRRCCGMRGKWWAVLLGVIVVLAIVAVLGGVLGTRKSSQGSDDGEEDTGKESGGTPSPESSRNNTHAAADPKTAIPQTGVAAVFLGNTLFTYYQDTSSRIIENAYIDGGWNISKSTVVTNAIAGSPLAAVSFDEGGSFGAALDSLGIESFKLYYGSTAGYIQEMGRYLNEPAWYPHQQFQGSDASSGVGCSFFSNLKDDADTALGAIINVYYRNTTTLELQQNWWSFTEQTDWHIGATGTGISIGTGTAISVTSDDGDGQEFVFFQNPDGAVVRATIDATSSAFGTLTNAGIATSGGRLASVYWKSAGTGTVYWFQDSSGDPTIWLSGLDLDGITVWTQEVPGSGELRWERVR